MLNIGQSRPTPLTSRPQAVRIAPQYAPQQPAAQSVQFGFGVPNINFRAIAAVLGLGLFGIASLAFMAGKVSSTAPTKPQSAPTVQQPTAQDQELDKLKKALEIEKLKTQLHEAQEANKPH